MDRLLGDLLEYARIGRTPEREGIEIVRGDALLNDIIALVSRDGFTVEIGGGFADIKVRKMPLQQVLMNLIGNAIKHHNSSEGHILVTVEDIGTRYAFAVKDDGPGIPAQYHVRIFKMFQTLRPKDQVEGSGMGLALVRKWVEFLGGTIEIDSAEGQGSTFRFTFPKDQA
jgi:signal transduction histidine kinase